MSLVLDAGALVALERGNRGLVALLKGELHAGRAPVTHGGVVGQVWRGGAGRQARLAALLPALQTVALDASLGRRAGVLLGRARMADVVDAALVLLAVNGDMILTSHPDDLARLAVTAGLDVDVVPV
jgi:hypothetical protein